MGADMAQVKIKKAWMTFVFSGILIACFFFLVKYSQAVDTSGMGAAMQKVAFFLLRS